MISELLAYDFMQRAILAVIAISIFSPILGLFLILRRQSLMSDTLSHVSQQPPQLWTRDSRYRSSDSDDEELRKAPKLAKRY